MVGCRKVFYRQSERLEEGDVRLGLPARVRAEKQFTNFTGGSRCGRDTGRAPERRVRSPAPREAWVRLGRSNGTWGCPGGRVEVAEWLSLSGRTAGSRYGCADWLIIEIISPWTILLRRVWPKMSWAQGPARVSVWPSSRTKAINLPPVATLPIVPPKVSVVARTNEPPLVESRTFAAYWERK